MRAFISVLEIAEEIGKTVAYVLARAVSDPGAVTLSVRTAGWPYRETMQVHYGQEEGWHQVGGACENLAELTALTSEVVAGQLLVDGVLRTLAPTGESLETCRMRLELEPPRALNPAQLLLDAESARAIRAESSRGTLRERFDEAVDAAEPLLELDDSKGHRDLMDRILEWQKDHATLQSYGFVW